MAEAAAKKKTLLEEFMSGCKKGFYIGAENIMPAMVLAYSLILFLNITGLMDIIANAVAPVMALFGLPGGAIVALISAFFAKAPRQRALLRLLLFMQKALLTRHRQLFCSRQRLPWARWLGILRAAY